MGTSVGRGFGSGVGATVVGRGVGSGAGIGEGFELGEGMTVKTPGAAIAVLPSRCTTLSIREK